MNKLLAAFSFFILIGCQQSENTENLKPPFSNIEDCVAYVNQSDLKKGYPKRKLESAINHCKNNSVLMNLKNKKEEIK
ncbi:hypothetical protein N9O84_00705 [Gammaproteobacteria bacterium]|nr:hypothetical protein [Gammaproteobacteria bacterium]